jgi:hypothetical protein
MRPRVAAYGPFGYVWRRLFADAKIITPQHYFLQYDLAALGGVIERKGIEQ